MNLSKLKELLRPWMQIDTWHTNHPLDDQRFHKALKSAFDTLGLQLSFDDFQEVMLELAEEHSPKMSSDYRAEEVEKFAWRAEHISSYLSDIT